MWIKKTMGVVPYEKDINKQKYRSRYQQLTYRKYKMIIEEVRKMIQEKEY